MRGKFDTFSLRMFATLCLAVFAVTGLWYFWNQTVARSRLLDLGRSYALAGGEDIAARAVVPTLVGEAIPDIVDRLASAHIGRGDILAMQLTDARGEVLGTYTDRSGVLAACRASIPLAASQTHSEALLMTNGAAWCLSVSVRQIQPTAECPAGGCATGRLWLVQSTRPVDTVLTQMRANVLRSAALVTALGMLLSFWLSRRLTQPLRRLEATMRAASGGARTVRATSSHGPQELRIMGSVFNAMQEQAAGYEETLKLQVQQRTQQLELARAQAVDAARYKTQFMAHVSHDMRMPLVVIKDLAQAAVRESAFGADKHLMEESLARIVHRTDALMKQIELVLQFMRSEEAMSLATPSQVLTLQQFFDTRRRDLELLAQRNGNVVVWNVKASDALVEEEAFATILENLIDNAAKFTDKGRIDVDIELQERWLVAKITDCGCGIAPEALPFVWDDFRRATAGGPATQGFGLGLAIVRRLVDRVGGERDIVSTPGHGTEVVIRLPRLLSMQPTLQGGIAEEHKVQGVHAQMREDRALQSTGEMIDQRVSEARDTRQGNIEEAARHVRHTE